MSRVGKKSIIIPEGVKVEYKDSIITVVGKKGSLTRTINHPILVEITDKEIFLSPSSNDIKNISAYWGLYRSLLQNMITGVSEGFEKKLRIEGVGYKVAMQGKGILLHLGYSHPIEFLPPEGITLSVDKNIISVIGIDKELVGQVSADIRSKREPEPYKGKGVRYNDEIVRMKVGKKAGS